MEKEILRKDIEIQSEEKDVIGADCRKIVDICGFREKKQGVIERQKKKVCVLDNKFASLDAKAQVAILCHMIGYIDASKDLISSGKGVRANEISKIFEFMEGMVNKDYGKM